MGRDKLWIEIAGRPVWRWSLDTLLSLPELTTVAVVTPAGSADRFRGTLPGRDRCVVTDGGATRAASVLAGLRALSTAGVADEAVVLVHDAARPAASRELMQRVLAEAARRPAVVPCMPVRDSLRRVAADGGDRLVEAVDRSGLVAAQTPQAARLGTLREALEAALEQGADVTDDAEALLAAGVPVHVIPGEPANVKLTEPDDELLLDAILRSRAVPLRDVSAPEARARVGIGFDAHRLVPGRPLRLGGLTFSDEARGLAGHSDGDAVLHAVTDALLGAARAGDIGQLFPKEERWSGADSRELLARAVRRIREAGCRPASVDVTVVAQRPAISPRVAEMAAAIGQAVGLPTDAVTVKGTTSDGLGFAGDEGIAAYAVAAVVPVESEA